MPRIPRRRPQATSALATQSQLRSQSFPPLPPPSFGSHNLNQRSNGATPEQLASIFELQRKGQWRLDFVNAENSMGFHAPQETARILGESIDLSRQAQIAAMQKHEILNPKHETNSKSQ